MKVEKIRTWGDNGYQVFYAGSGASVLVSAAEVVAASMSETARDAVIERVAAMTPEEREALMEPTPKAEV